MGIPLGGPGGGEENKNAGHVSGTPQLGLQTGGAGHNLAPPVEMLLHISRYSKTVIIRMTAVCTNKLFHKLFNVLLGLTMRLENLQNLFVQ